MYAIIVDRNKQYKITNDQIFKIDFINKKINDVLTIDNILLLIENEKIIIGNPYIKNKTIELKILNHVKDKKISIIKFKRRKHYMKHMGHRQNFTLVKVISVISNTTGD
jgi:large subunit ribosomal protein L21